MAGKLSLEELIKKREKIEEQIKALHGDSSNDFEGISLIEGVGFSDTAIDTLQDILLIYDSSSGKAIRWNKAFKERVGYSDKEIANLKVPESYFDPESLVKAANLNRKALQGKTVKYEMDLITKKGDRIPHEYTQTALVDKEGKYRLIFSIGREIRERRNYKNLLGDHRRFDKLISHLSDVFLNIEYDELDKEIVNALKKTILFFGAGRAGIFQIVDIDDNYRITHEYHNDTQCKPFPKGENVKNIFADAANLIAQGKIFHFAQLDKLPSNLRSLRPYYADQGIKSSIAVPLQSFDKVFGSLSITFFDHEMEWDSDSINRAILLGQVFSNALARMRVEKTLRSADLRLRSLIENTTDAVFCFEVIDPIPIMFPINEQVDRLHHSKLVDCNLVYAKHYGVDSVNDILGKELVEIFKGKSANLDTLFQDILNHGYRVINSEGVETLEDGTERHYLNNGYGIIEDGMLRRIWGSFRDITEQRNMEEHLRQAEKMEAVGQLAGGIAHDFNNQLSGIVGYADLIRGDAEDGSDNARYADNILTAGKRAADLTQELLAFSRKGKYFSVHVDMHKLVNEVVTLLQRSIDKRIIIKQLLVAQQPFVKGDPSQLQNALLNLTINARDAMPDGGELVIASEITHLDNIYLKQKRFELTAGNYVHITIIDSGTGIDSALLKRIFEPFYTTKKQGKGTGMGLAAVYGTAKSHNGIIDVESEVGKGTSMHLYLPQSIKDLPADSEQEEKEPETAGAATILLVDDEEMVREITTDILEKLGYAVLTCEDGCQAVEQYKNDWKNIDLVILDMVMPNMNGKDAFLAMKEINPDIKALLSSGYSITGEARSILKAGINGFIQKPYRRVELSKKIAEILNTKPQK